MLSDCKAPFKGDGSVAVIKFHTKKKPWKVQLFSEAISYLMDGNVLESRDNFTMWLKSKMFDLYL